MDEKTKYIDPFSL